MGLNYNGLGSLWDEKFKKQQLQKLLIMIYNAMVGI